MPRLLSCPFCRELFGADEGPRCPHCDLPLVALDKLPPSAEALAEEPLVPADPPEDQRQNWLYSGRGRGLLFCLAAVGLLLFFSPWVSLERPDPVVWSGFDLARGNLGFLWGGAIGWFLLLPLVATRRSVTELRGIRVIAFTFAVMTFGEGLLLLLRPPVENAYFSARLDYRWGLYASTAVSLLAAFVALRLGGSLQDLRDLQAAPERRGPGDPLH